LRAKRACFKEKRPYLQGATKSRGQLPADAVAYRSRLAGEATTDRDTRSLGRFPGPSLSMGSHPFSSLLSFLRIEAGGSAGSEMRAPVRAEETGWGTLKLLPGGLISRRLREVGRSRSGRAGLLTTHVQQRADFRTWGSCVDWSS